MTFKTMPRCLLPINLYEPFKKLALKAYEENEVPYIVYYMDDLTENLDEHFNCAAIIEASRLESDHVAEKYGIGTVNSYLQTKCGEVNSYIIGKLRDEKWITIDGEDLTLPEFMAKFRWYCFHMGAPWGRISFIDNYSEIL